MAVTSLIARTVVPVMLCLCESSIEEGTDAILSSGQT